jgi:hypothetical protein
LFTGETDPQLQLSISGIHSVCMPGACTISTTTAVPDITAYSLSSNKLTITYANLAAPFDQFELNITYAG